MKIRIIFLCLCSMFFIFLFSGCSPYPKGLEETKILSGEKKAELIRTAFNTDEVQHGLETRGLCEITFKWALVKWQNDHRVETSYYDYGYENLEEEIIEEREIYIAVVIRMGDSTDYVVDYEIRVLIQPDTLQIIDTNFEPITPLK